MTQKLKTLTVAELIARLQEMPPDDEVRVWLPGSTIALSSVFKYKGTTRIEGDIDPDVKIHTILNKTINDFDAAILEDHL